MLVGRMVGSKKKKGLLQIAWENIRDFYLWKVTESVKTNSGDFYYLKFCHVGFIVVLCLYIYNALAILANCVFGG